SVTKKVPEGTFTNHVMLLHQSLKKGLFPFVILSLQYSVFSAYSRDVSYFFPGSQAAGFLLCSVPNE
ncbi:hypothetical protein, partial [Laceyella putida]